MSAVTPRKPMSIAAGVAVSLAALHAEPPSSRIDATPELAYSAFSPDLGRKFDFWLGEWDVEVAVPVADGTLEEVGTASALVYPILGGKGVLEFWKSSTSSGLSVRYPDPAKKTWVEWLFRSEGNQVFLDRFEGEFRHGRADLHRTSVAGDGARSTTAHTFSDITPFSLRWEASRSSDGGKRWETEQVREYTRSAIEARLPILREFAPPVVKTGQCDDRAFRYHELLIGRWIADGMQFDAAPVLDGCGVLGILRVDGGPDELFLLTFDVSERRWITATLDGQPGTVLALYSGTTAWYDLVADPEGELSWLVSTNPDGGPEKRLTDAGAALGLFRGERKIELRRLEDQRQ